MISLSAINNGGDIPRSITIMLNSFMDSTYYQNPDFYYFIFYTYILILVTMIDNVLYYIYRNTLGK